MKKFLCYDTNDATSGKINVSTNGVLKPNSTVPSTNGTTYQQLVTDGDGNTKWEDRLAYDDSKRLFNSFPNKIAEVTELCSPGKLAELHVTIKASYFATLFLYIQ